ncbi:hypothetical protein [Micromonospora sp. LOL_021]|uniref:hypothetical protein n=1 Tax=Micromonospora sp. LOL_021 TaxID=3345417 RepID=UPI003A8413CA
MQDVFRTDRTYESVFLVLVDAAGHSDMVANNPRDRALRAFDLLRERLLRRLGMLAEQYRCARAQLWRWAGDGGLVVIHDDEESIARDVALSYVRDALNIDLPHLRDEFASLGIKGRLRLRIAVHRGVVRYRGQGEEGSIYSPDINFAAHLEKVTPPDSVAISDAVWQVAGRYSALFEEVGSYEGHRIHLLVSGGGAGHARRSWLCVNGLAAGTALHGYAERPSQQEKSRLVAAAEAEVIDLGTALRTASNYLVTTERPAYFRDAVLDLLRRGGTYRCVLMDPDCTATTLLAEQRGEQLGPKIRQSLASLQRFRDQLGDAGQRLHIQLTETYPGMACLAVDLRGAGGPGLMLTSPYLLAPPDRHRQLERSDMPHYLVSEQAGRLYQDLRAVVLGFVEEEQVRAW